MAGFERPHLRRLLLHFCVMQICLTLFGALAPMIPVPTSRRLWRCLQALPAPPRQTPGLGPLPWEGGTDLKVHTPRMVIQTNHWGIGALQKTTRTLFILHRDWTVIRSWRWQPPPISRRRPVPHRQREESMSLYAQSCQECYTPHSTNTMYHCGANKPSSL